MNQKIVLIFFVLLVSVLAKAHLDSYAPVNLDPVAQTK